MSIEKTIICDAGPLITLEKLSDGFSFIRKLYNKIIIPPSVFNEINRKAIPPNLYTSILREFIDISTPNNIVSLPSFKLHLGELEAISLAKERNLALLIEEREGRAAAESIGVSISGIAGQIIKATRLEIISQQEGLRKAEELYNCKRINKNLFKALNKKLSDR